MISTNQRILNAVQYFEDDESHFVVTFSCHLSLVVYSDQKVKMSEISAPGMEVRIWMINLISTEPLSSNGELSDPLCDSKNRGLTLVRLGSNISVNLIIKVVYLCLHLSDNY